MPKMRAQSYTGATERGAAETAARTLSATLHKLHGGDRTETLDLSRLSPAMLARAQALQAAGQLGRTTGYSTPVLAPTDPDDIDSGGEVRVFLGADAAELAALQARLTLDGGLLLTVSERLAVQTAITEAVDRVRPNSGGAGELGRDIADGVGGRP